jgi:DNA-binding transcriptional LysR family regulator
VVDLSSLDLNLLRTLQALLRTSSLAEAAAEMGVTPSAVSHRLRRLQEALGDPLLVRSGRSMTLTTRAEALRPTVDHAIHAIRAVFAREAFVPAEATGAFRIAATDHVSALFGTQLERLLAEEAPALALHMRPVGSASEALLARGELEFGIGFFRYPPADLVLQRLFDDGYVCLVRHGHPLQQTPTLPTYLAARHVLIAPRGTPQGRVDLVLQEQGLRRRVVRLESGFLAAARLVAGTDLVLTMSRRLAVHLAETLPVTLVDAPLELPSYSLVQIWHPRHTDDPQHRWMRDRVRDIAESLPTVPLGERRVTVLE